MRRECCCYPSRCTLQRSSGGELGSGKRKGSWPERLRPKSTFDISRGPHLKRPLPKGRPLEMWAEKSGPTSQEVYIRPPHNSRGPHISRGFRRREEKVRSAGWSAKKKVRSEARPLELWRRKGTHISRGELWAPGELWALPHLKRRCRCFKMARCRM